MRNRLELARANMNHLYDYLSALPSEVRLCLVSKAYAHANSNKHKVMSEERTLSQQHQIAYDAHTEMVNHILFKLTVESFSYNASMIYNSL